MEEIWKDIKGFEGLYQVSNIGRVKSLSRTVRSNTCGFRELPERILSNCKSSCGYNLVVLCKNGRRYNKMVHRLVAETFIYNPNDYKEVNHKDENKLNNIVTNLEWCNRKYNANYGTGIERCSKQKWKPVVMLDKISNNVIQEFGSAREASLNTGVNYKSISSVCRGRNKTAGGFNWKFK